VVRREGLAVGQLLSPASSPGPCGARLAALAWNIGPLHWPGSGALCGRGCRGGAAVQPGFQPPAPPAAPRHRPALTWRVTGCSTYKSRLVTHHHLARVAVGHDVGAAALAGHRQRGRVQPRHHACASHKHTHGRPRRRGKGPGGGAPGPTLATAGCGRHGLGWERVRPREERQGASPLGLYDTLTAMPVTPVDR
jgi:hypothetical protein